VAAIQGRTRAQLRRAVADNLGAVHVGSATATGTTSTLIDNNLLGGDDTYNGYWLLAASGSVVGERERVSDYVASSFQLVTNPFSTTLASAIEYELYKSEHPPDRIERFINQAIVEATGRVFDREEDVSLHADGGQVRYDIPSQFAMLEGVFYRYSVKELSLHKGDSTFGETTDADFTQSLDTQDKKQGAQSLKIVIVAAAAAGDRITKAITSVDLSGYTHLEGWVKSSVATAAVDLEIRLDSGVVQGDTTDLEILALPALVANTWTYFRVALANPRSDTAIVSIGLKYVTDIGAVTLWLDDLKVTHNDEQRWRELPRHLWYIDQQTRDLVLTKGGQRLVGYSLIKLIGGDKPALLSTALTSTGEQSATEVDDRYIIARATALEALAASGGPVTDPEALRQLATFWSREAEIARKGLPFLVGVRHVTG